MIEQPATASEWARLYAGLGWRVFPVVPGGKRPSYRGWQRDASIDPALIDRYFRTEPGPNIGLVCGEVFDVFDIEAGHLAALRAWMETRNLALPRTPLARTGRGGIHVLVSRTGASGSRDLFLCGVHVGELKSIGGLIVAPPSRTEQEYRWLRRPDEATMSAAPGWLLALATRAPAVRRERTGGANPHRSRAQLDALARAIANAGVGRRNKILYWAIRRAEEEGLPIDMAAATLGRSAFAAGLDRSEIRATVRSAIEAARR